MQTITKDEVVTYREYTSINDAEAAKSLLDAARIWSMINNEYMSQIYPMAIAAQLVVRREDLERVMALLEGGE